MTNTEKLFKTLVKQIELGKISTILEVETQVDILCEKFDVELTSKQKEMFIKAFCEKYLPDTVVTSDVNDIDDFFEEPEDEIEKLLKKIEVYKAKLLENPENKISIQSMISKLRKKLRNLGYKMEMAPRTQAKTIKTLKAKLEQLELDLALAPMQKRKSVQSMISKIKKQLRDFGDTEFVKQPKEVIVKQTPAEKIGLDEEDFDTALINSPENDWNNMQMSEPFNKLIIMFLVRYAKKHYIDLKELAKWVLKYRKNIFNKIYTNDTEIGAIIERETLKNLINEVKSVRSLTSTEIDNIYLYLPDNLPDEINGRVLSASAKKYIIVSLARADSQNKIKRIFKNIGINYEY